MGRVITLEVLTNRAGQQWYPSTQSSEISVVVGRDHLVTLLCFGRDNSQLESGNVLVLVFHQIGFVNFFSQMDQHLIQLIDIDTALIIVFHLGGYLTSGQIQPEIRFGDIARLLQKTTELKNPVYHFSASAK